jgi:Cdc6-like AAA superfamily ATPase
MSTTTSLTITPARHNSVPADDLCRRCDLAGLAFETTSELEDLPEVVGHPRALDAMRFGIGIRKRGFNLFLLGPAGTGKYTTLRTLLEKKAKSEPTPPDWCYVNNFNNPENPRSLQVPAGKGVSLRNDMLHLLDDLRSAIPSAFQSENYAARKRVIEQEVKNRQEKAFEVIQQEADEKNIAVLRTPTGIAPLRLRATGRLSARNRSRNFRRRSTSKSRKRLANYKRSYRMRFARRPATNRKGGRQFAR